MTGTRISDMTVIGPSAAMYAPAVKSGDNTNYRVGLTITPHQYGAVGDGVADDTTALTNCIAFAAANGLVVDGNGQTFGIRGNLRIDNQTAPSLRNLEIKQLSPSGTVGGIPDADRRTLFFSNCQRIRLDRVRVNRGTSKTHGSLNSAAGIYIDGGSGHHITNVECYGDGIGSGFVASNTTDSYFANIISHDIGYDNTSATDDQVQGVWLNANTDCVFEALKGYNLTGNATGMPASRYTRGIVANGNIRCAFVAPNAHSVDQGMDLSGTSGNIFCTITNMRFKDCASWGLKIANSGYAITVDGGVCIDCGLSGVMVSGPSEAGLTYKGEFITVQNVVSYNTGSNGASWGSHIGFRVMPGAFDPTYPRGITFANCLAADVQGSPTMTTGFSNEIAYDGSKRYTRLLNCRSIGHTVAIESGFHRLYCRVNGTGTQSIPNSADTAMNWDTEVEDSMAMHSTSSGTNIITVPIGGFYEVRANISFASNATGIRKTVIYKNGSSTGLERSLNAVNGAATNVAISERMSLSAGDQIVIAANQTSGGSLNADRTASWLSVEIVREL